MEKEFKKDAVIRELAEIRAELNEIPRHKLLLESQVCYARSSLGRFQADLDELLGREAALKTSEIVHEIILREFAAKEARAAKTLKNKEEKARATPDPNAAPDTDDLAVKVSEKPLTPIDQPKVSTEPLDKLDAYTPPKPEPKKQILVNLGDEVKDWTPLDWKRFYRTGEKPAPKLKLVGATVDEPGAPEPKALEISPLDGDVVR